MASAGAWRARAAWAVFLAALLPGCFGVREPPPTVQGPTDLGQLLHIDVQNNRPEELDLRIALAGQPEIRYQMTPGQTARESRVPHVARAYDGSIPPGSEVVVREGENKARMVVEDRGGPVWLLIEPNPSDGSLGLARFDDQPGYD